jgi:hypothetical protein
VEIPLGINVGNAFVRIENRNVADRPVTGFTNVISPEYGHFDSTGENASPKRNENETRSLDQHDPATVLLPSPVIFTSTECDNSGMRSKPMHNLTPASRFLSETDSKCS